MKRETCVLCGAESKDVSVGLIEWEQPIDGARFTAAPRCRDKAGCRSRVKANGEKWEVAE